MNGYGKIRRCTEKRRVVAELYLYLAAALTVLRRLINEARTRYRWRPDPPPADSSNHQLPDVLSGFSGNSRRSEQLAIFAWPKPRPQQRTPMGYEWIVLTSQPGARCISTRRRGWAIADR
jgi:hypothetical protein